MTVFLLSLRAPVVSGSLASQCKYTITHSALSLTQKPISPRAVHHSIHSFHVTCFLAAKKPSAAVVFPPQKRLNREQSSKKRPEPGANPSSASTSSSSSINHANITAAVPKIASERTSDHVLSHKDSHARPLLSNKQDTNHKPIKSTQISGYVAGPRQPIYDPTKTYVGKLADSSRPTLIYLTKPQHGFTAMSYIASLFFGMVAAYSFQQYHAFSHTNPWLWYSGVVISSCWVGFSAYTAYAPLKMIKSVTVLPAPVVGGVRTGKPSLRLEFLNTLPLITDKPVEVSLTNIRSSSSFQPVFFRLLKRGSSMSARSKALGMISEPFRNLFRIVAKITSRRSMVWVRVNGWNYKIDLDPTKAQTLDYGRALDELIKVDSVPRAWLRKYIS